VTYSRKLRGSQFNKLTQINFWFFFNIFILLTWIGALPAEDPYIIVGQTLTLTYFLYFLYTPFIELSTYKKIN
jgi:ubiquinol-cytochrome c reductase cytochrome b subunit